MRHIQLGTLQVPSLGLGTYRLNGPNAVSVLLQAYEMGYRLIDTAQLYHNESEVGQSILQSGISRDQFTIITKVWPTHFTQKQFLPSVKDSLKKLKTDYVDLLLIHWPHPHFEVDQYIHFLTQAKDEGLTKEIGVSNYNTDQLASCLKLAVDIKTNEIEFHPWIDQQKLWHWMSAHNLPVIAYAPLGRGRHLENGKLQEVAQQHGRTPAQIVLRWLIQKEHIIAIPKSGSLMHLRENYDVFSFTLSPEEMQSIDQFRHQGMRVVGAQPGAVWD